MTNISTEILVVLCIAATPLVLVVIKYILHWAAKKSLSNHRTEKSNRYYIRPAAHGKYSVYRHIPSVGEPGFTPVIRFPDELIGTYDTRGEAEKDFKHLCKE